MCFSLPVSYALTLFVTELIASCPLFPHPSLQWIEKWSFFYVQLKGFYYIELEKIWTNNSFLIFARKKGMAYFLTKIVILVNVLNK